MAFLRDDICPSPSAYRDTFVIDLADEITVAEGVKVEKKSAIIIAIWVVNSIQQIFTSSADLS